MSTHMFAFATALIAAVSLTPAARQLAFKLDFIDRPDARKLHLKPMPLLGGLAIYTAAVLAILLFTESTAQSQIIGILAGATLLAVVGIMDDRGLLHHQIKLLVAMPLAALILLISGVHAEVFSWPPADYALTLFWVVGITAAFSIHDHMDGLCAGIAAIASAFFLLFALLGQQVLVATLAAAMLGASLGFLQWNLYPAKIFMGDAGAMFLGFMMATLALKLRPPVLLDTPPWMISVLIVGVPIFDTALISISRARRGLIPFTSPGKDHTAHRLANLRLGQRRAVLSLYALGIFFGAVALSLTRLPAWQSYVVVGALVLAGLVAIFLLERAPYEKQRKEKPQMQRAGKA